MLKIDTKDKKILRELDRNSRQSYQDIGKKIRLSKDSVFYRMKRLEKEKIIEQYQTLIDVGKLGYISFRVFLKTQNTTSKIEKDIIQFLKKQKIVVWMVSVEGYWNINTWILCKEVSELDAFWKDFNARYLNYIADKRLSIFTEIDYFERVYLLENKNEKPPIRFVTTPISSLADSTDIKILEILNMNARKPFLEIAELVGLSPKQVSTRIKKLEANNVIVGYKTMLNLEKIGYKHYHINFKVKNLTDDKEHAFKEFCFIHPNIIYENYSICGPDLEIDVEVESIEELRVIIQEIKDKFSSIIQDYEILHYLKQHKYIFLPL